MPDESLSSVDTPVNKADAKPCFVDHNIIKWGSQKLTHILEKYIVSISVVSTLRKFGIKGQGFEGAVG